MGVGVGALLALGLTSAASAAPAASAATAAPIAPRPSWHQILSVPSAPSNAVGTVVATGKTSGWAFLASGTVAYQRTGATTWQKVAFPDRGGAVKVAAASSPSNVWAAYRTAGGTHLDRWTGRSWTVVKSFPGQVTGLSVLAPNDVWVFGGLRTTNAGVFHFDGHRWTQVTSAYQGGYAASDRNVWAYAGTKIAHYDGRRWTVTDVAKLFPAKTPGQYTAPGLTGVTALAPGNVYATGNGPYGPHSANAVFLHYNGHAWSRAATAGFISQPGQQFTPDGQGGLWLPGQNVDGPSLLRHYFAGKVTTTYLPGSVGLPTAVYSVSRIPGSTAVLAGGATLNQTKPTADRSVVFQYS